jgi:hypothetical protein
VVLLLTLISGLPQIGISLSGLDGGREQLTPVPLTRSLLLDKLLPEASAITPPHSSDFPPLLTKPAPPLALEARKRLGPKAEAHEASRWLLNLVVRLYRHHSSYV